MLTRTTAGEIQLQSGSVGYSGQNRIDRNLSEDGEVKEMIIGVGNEQSTCMGVGVIRALGCILPCSD